MSSMAAASPKERPVMLVISDTVSRLIILKMLARVIVLSHWDAYKVQVLRKENIKYNKIEI